MIKKRMRQTVLIIFLAVITAISPSCTGNRAQREGAQLRWGFTTEPASLDPLNPANTADGRSVLFNVFEGLVKPRTDGTMQPCIGESWTIEQNARVYNFILRENMRFHDGSIVTPADVKFSLDAAIAAGFHGLDRIEEVRIRGNNQIRVILKSSDPDFLPYLTVGIVKDGNTDREKKIIGTGPFFIESYTPQRNLILTKFDNYWQNNLPYLDKITVVFFANFDALMTSLRGGAIDGAFITGSMAAQLDHRQFDIFHNNSAAVQLLALNNDSGYLNDKNLRLAVNHGVDVGGIIEAAFFGQGSPSGSPVIPGLSLYYENLLSYQYDPGLAKELLNQAGFDETNRFSLEITVPSNYSMHVDTAQVIANQLEKIGIDAGIKLVDWPTWISQVYSQRQFQATVISLDSPVASPRGFLDRYRSGSDGNFINFNSADFDRVYDAVLAEADLDRRIRLYKDAQKIISENAASVYIQDILYFIVFRGGAFGGALNFPLYVIDFSAIYRIDGN